MIVLIPRESEPIEAILHQSVRSGDVARISRLQDWALLQSRYDMVPVARIFAEILDYPCGTGYGNLQLGFHRCNVFLRKFAQRWNNRALERALTGLLV